MSLLKRIERSLDQRLRALFGGGAAREPGAREGIELYRDALDQISARAAIGKRGDRVFPFDRVVIELLAVAPERRAILETLFDPAQLSDDIREVLTEEHVVPPAGLTVDVRYVESAALELRVICDKAELPQPASTHSQFPLVRAIVTTLVGVPSSQHFVADRPNVNIGREEEVVDASGRPLRRNDLFFPETAHEANASVSRSHAHLRFDGASGDWRIYDDGSSFGTGLMREGRRIEVPPHAARGVVLRPGDEICLGQVRLRIEN